MSNIVWHISIINCRMVSVEWCRTQSICSFYEHQLKHHQNIVMSTSWHLLKFSNSCLQIFESFFKMSISRFSCWYFDFSVRSSAIMEPSQFVSAANFLQFIWYSELNSPFGRQEIMTRSALCQVPSLLQRWKPRCWA